ncbi:MAG TPA: hypothetical protein VFS02_22385 [Telluria sp.]|nr:hypothetical protein [Telluria sp.]
MAGKGVTAEQTVLALKKLGRSVPATDVAWVLSVDSRAVATALRQPTKDGRVSITYRRGAKGEQRRGFYRFLRLTAK